MFSVEDCIGFITNKSAKKVSDIFNEILVSKGITRVQWIALYYIKERKNINQQELAELMDIKNSTVARLLDRMQKDNLIIRFKDKKDRRNTFLNLSEKGRKLIESLYFLGEDFSLKLVEEISNEELEIFKKIIKKIELNACDYLKKFDL